MPFYDKNGNPYQSPSFCDLSDEQQQEEKRQWLKENPKYKKVPWWKIEFWGVK